MSKVFDIDIKKLIILLLPIDLRKSKIVAFLRAMATPVASLRYRFIVKRTADLYKLNHNSQVCYLRAALNDNFDVEERRIRIIDGNQYNRNYIYTRGEEKPEFIGAIFLRDRADYADTGVDFIVEVPEGIYDQYRMQALIDFYRLASKRYKIVQV
ncbi:hypothetical protein [Labilibaculum euxinus]